MADLLKDRYDQAFIEQLVDILGHALSSFNGKIFYHQVFNKQWETLELKDRMRHIAMQITAFLSNDVKTLTREVLSIVDSARHFNVEEQGFEYMFLPEIIEKNCLDAPDESLSALRELTQFVSCEFAVRPFIDRYQDRSLDFLRGCTAHKSHHVRRWASEGSRPLLPWAMVLQGLKKDPKPILPVLEPLMNDNSEYVRRSVANNLNDISKHHPELVLTFVQNRLGISQETDKLIKHSLRTLLKKGDQRALSSFGLGPDPHLEVVNFELSPSTITMESEVRLTFTVKNTGSETKKLRLEYALYFLRKNGSHSKKVFKISERQINSSEILTMEKRHVFRKISTRSYYSGKHSCSLVVNGVEGQALQFNLKA